MIVASISIICLTVISAVLLRENRRLTNLVVARNPDAVIAVERQTKQKKKDRDDKPHHVWANPSEAVGP